MKIQVKYVRNYNTHRKRKKWWCCRAEQANMCHWGLWKCLCLPVIDGWARLRLTFHVSGTKNWCLSPQDIADPFFAYCKQHADRFDRKWKRKNYLALQSYCKVSLQERERQLPPEAQVRLQRPFSSYLVPRSAILVCLGESTTSDSSWGCLIPLPRGQKWHFGLVLIGLLWLLVWKFK